LVNNIWILAIIRLFIPSTLEESILDIARIPATITPIPSTGGIVVRWVGITPTISDPFPILRCTPDLIDVGILGVEAEETEGAVLGLSFL